MDGRQDPNNRLNRDRLLRGIKKFASSEVSGKAKRYFTALILFLLAINGLNVVNSYVGRDFMTAIENRNTAEFIWQAVLYVGVFAGSTIVAVFYRFIEDRLGLLWREWLTRKLVNRYLEHPVYYRLNNGLGANGKTVNPDQRISEDVRAFTVTTLSFMLMLLNAILTVVAFSGVLWSISPLLFLVAVLYSAIGSFLTIALGRPLVGLNYMQFDKEANFRADLIHVRENAASVALLRREGRLKARLLRHLDDLAANFRRIVAVQRNLGFFTTGYNYLIQIIPALVVAPLFIRGQVEFGVITQSAMAFAHLMGAFSLIVTHFQSISSFTAVVARLGSLMEAMDQAQSIPVPKPDVGEIPIGAACVTSTESAIQLCVGDADRGITYERLTLLSPVDDRLLIKELTVSIPNGMRVLISGANEAAKVALLRATAGIWDTGEGRITRPSPEHIIFLPERPYLPPGTLREVLLRTGKELANSDGQILSTLRELNIDPVLTRCGGLDGEQDWANILSLAEQQVFAIARLLLATPCFAFLHRVGASLAPGQVEQILRILSQHAIAYISLGEANGSLDYYDAVLEIARDGAWTWRPVRDQ
ncbi:MAG: ABC transporter ATP-binding protein/permease [Gammaproteobacteria bacterium]